MKRKAGTAVLILTPFVMFGVFEWITRNLMEIELIYRILNLLLFFLLYFVVFAVTNSMGVGFSLLNVILTVWALAEHYVVEFRGRPIMIWDIMAFRTAMTVADTYQYDITLQVAAGVLVILLWTVLIWLFPVRLPSQKIWAGTAAGSLVCMAVFLFNFFPIWNCSIGNGNQYVVSKLVLCTVWVSSFYSADGGLPVCGSAGRLFSGPGPGDSERNSGVGKRR